MKTATVDFEDGFHVITGDQHSQAASMVIGAGSSEGGPDNRHQGADQWLYVTSGEGEATIAGRRIELSAGSLVLIERGETHEIRNTGREPLRTLSFYVPPAYSAGGHELAAGKG